MREWLIWSIEHNAWWKPLAHGYTQKREEAGRYTLKEAKDFMRQANKFCGDQPNEAIVEYIKE